MPLTVGGSAPWFLWAAMALMGASPPTILAQSKAVPAFGSESNLVLIPVVVLRKHTTRAMVDEFYRCSWKNKLIPGEPLRWTDCWKGLEIRGLTTKDFHLFDDGQEEKIQDVTFQAGSLVDAHNNAGWHEEWGGDAAAFWSGPPMPPYGSGGTGHLHFYVLAYNPPQPADGRLHRLRVEVCRHDTWILYRKEYRNAPASPSDSLAQSVWGERMEAELASSKAGKLHLRVQAGFFYTAGRQVRAYVSLKFSERAVGMGALGVLHRLDGTPAARFGGVSSFDSATSWYPALQPSGRGSDQDRGSTESPYFNRGPQDYTGYQTEVHVPFGRYMLRVVLSDGEKFGRAEAPLDVPAWDGKTLATSSVMVCKLYRDAHMAAEERAAANLAPQYVPLVSKGIEFTPAGDTSFDKKSKAPLIVYFEVYEPLLAAATGAAANRRPEDAGSAPPSQNAGNVLKVEAHIRILDAKTGAVVKDFPPVDAREYETPGSWKIPIARKIPFEEFPKGAYRLEVQATDSAGQATPWQSANFTVE